VERFPLLPFDEYLRIFAECDISVAPLENYIFNEAKSNIKYLEASMVKLPSVCSPRAAFSQVIVHGENGFLCETEAEWEDALTLLVTDGVRRTQVSEAAHALVGRRYALESIAQKQVAPLFLDFNKASGKLRVLSVNCFYKPRSFGGATIVMEEVNKRMNARGDFEMSVFTALPTSEVPPYMVKRYEADGVNVYGVGLPVLMNEKTKFENPFVVSAFQNVLAAVRPDIVHFHCVQGLGVSIVDLCAKLGIKYIITLHDAWWLCLRQFMLNRQGKYCGQETIDPGVCGRCVHSKSLNLYRSKLLTQVLRNASVLLAPSRFFADFYVANGFKNVRVNKNGVAKPGSALRFRRKGRLRFGYVGGNTEIKGVHLVKKVFSKLVDQNVSLMLVDNALNCGFVSYGSRDLAGLSHAEIVPAYTQNTIDDFFSTIDVLLFPSQWKESFGLTVREALARNVWVISTDAGGAVEDIIPGENGYIIPLADRGEALRRAVIDTLAYFDSIPPGEQVALSPKGITFFEEQAAELASIFKEIATPVV